MKIIIEGTPEEIAEAIERLKGKKEDLIKDAPKADPDILKKAEQDEVTRRFLEELGSKRIEPPITQPIPFYPDRWHQPSTDPWWTNRPFGPIITFDVTTKNPNPCKCSPPNCSCGIL